LQVSYEPALTLRAILTLFKGFFFFQAVRAIFLLDRQWHWGPAPPLIDAAALHLFVLDSNSIPDAPLFSTFPSHIQTLSGAL
jgi:hypothetical protein